MSLIYPRHCESCGNTLYKHETFICTFCQVNLPRSNYHLLAENEISRMLTGRVPVLYAAAFFLYEKRGRVQNMLHAIKYDSQKELGQHLGQLYGKELSDAGVLQDIDVIIPVPLHVKKLKQRGYNQSEWFARGLGKTLGKPLEINNLVRQIHTATQTRKKKYQRWENVEGIFSLAGPGALQGRHVLLVDDVITTGATIEAAWLALREAPGIRISVLSIAFAGRAA